ncbi:MAG: D-isomer specific 2-hydroxyacid dehydrogenase NAD-binding protein [Rhodoglobus sp.]|nr:D-isomer specific 2-hydroxyacid dehydrogenase NAD-binding protein [Rhodoglobus sp.]
MTTVALLTRIVGNDASARARLADAGIDVAIDLAGYDALMAGPDGLAAWHAVAAGIDGLVVGLQPVDRALFEAAPRLKYVLRVGTGLDNVDVEEARKRGIVASNLAGLNADAVAEYAFALLLAAARRIPEADASMRKGEWTRFTGRHLGGRTLGLLGFGAIGGAMVPKARGFDMDVIVYRRHPDPASDAALGIRTVGLDELLAASDFISVHVPLTDDTRHLIGREQIARMRDGVVIVNTARGEVVDEAALAEALHSGKVTSAALDVFADEPPTGSPLLIAPHVVLSPHNGGYSDTVMAGIAAAAADFMIEHL